MDLTIGILIIWIVCGVIAAFMGTVKGRSGCGWFLIGFLLGPIGIIIAAIVKAKRPQPEVKLTIKYPSPPTKEEPEQEPTPSCEEQEDLGSLLKQATVLKDSDIDTAIRIVKQVISKYERRNEFFSNIQPIYFKLAYYLQKKGNRDEAWRVYNQMVQKACQEGEPLLLGMALADIYSRMGALRKKEKGYKDAILFEIRSYINRNEALHLQARRKELLLLERLIKQLKPLFNTAQIKHPEKLLKKSLRPLIKEWRKKPPAKEPFIDSVKKREKIRKRHVSLTQLSNKQLNLIMEEIRQSGG